MMIVMKGIKEVAQVHRKEVFRFCLHRHLNLIQHHLKSKEVVRVHLKETDLMIILKGILSEVVKVLIHRKEVLRIIQWMKEII